MKTILVLCAAVALLAFSGVRASGDDEVLDLTNDNFEAALEQHKLILVEFFAPWCGHCKALAPEYDKAAKELAGTGLKLAKVDADNEVNRPLAQRFGIRGFPTLKLFRNGAVAGDYQGERKAGAIVSYLKKQALPAVTEFQSNEEIQQFTKDNKVVVVAFVSSKDSAEFKTFSETAEKLREKFVFGAVVGNSDIATIHGAKIPGVVLFKSFDEGKNVLEGDLSGLEAFVNTNSVPLIDEIGPTNYMTYVESGLPLAYLFVDLTVKDQLETYLAVVRDLAKGQKGKINWVYIDWAKYAKHSERLGLSGEKVPALAIESEGRHWAFDESVEITAESVSKWVGSFLEGTLEATVKSEPVPASQDGPVTILVAKNFDELVIKSKKDVLVEFYAPWCGHCKQLAPVFDQLGKALKSVPTVTIAKIDATANDVDPKYDIRGFPTLKLFKSTGEVVEYEGDRSLDDLLKFVRENAATKFEVSDVKKDEL